MGHLSPLQSDGLGSSGGWGQRCLGPRLFLWLCSRMPEGWVSEVKCGVEDGSQVDLWLGSECLDLREGLREETAINGPKEVEIDACN